MWWIAGRWSRARDADDMKEHGWVAGIAPGLSATPNTCGDVSIVATRLKRRHTSHSMTSARSCLRRRCYGPARPDGRGIGAGDD